MTSVLRRGKLGQRDRDTQGERQVKTEAEITTMNPQAKECQCCQLEAGKRHGTDCPLECPQGTNSAGLPDSRSVRQ